ncbi:hypothetical protein [Streptomyces sp. NPDC001296]
MTRARIREAHLLEVQTGYRSGSRHWAQPGEPRPEYDPAHTTLAERRRTKAAELKELDRQEAKHLGLEWFSERTLKRMAAQYAEHGLMGLADGRWTPPLRGGRAVTEEVAEAIRAVHAECLHRSKVSMKTKERMIHQYVAEKFGTEVHVPHYTTLAKVWKEWFGSSGARQRYVRSAAAVETGKAKVVVTRPGQVVALDTTPLPVRVLDDVFGIPITAHLTLALDAYSHSLVAFRLTPVSESSVEVAMLLRDVLRPLPMRPDWGEEMAWPDPGVPAALVAQFAGHEVAGLPFFALETVTSDHGSVYKSRQIVSVARQLGIDLLPARAMRPTGHLPVLFACPQHQRFLQHTCPACGNLAGPRLPAAHRISLHPTQCRLTISRSNALCGQRLDHAEDLHPTPASALIDLHTRLEGLIRSSDPHHARQSLSDLRMIVPLLYFSWPQSKGLLRAELQDTAAAFLKSCWWAPSTPHYVKVRYDTVDRLPPDAPASAAFLDAADRLLRSDDLQDRLTDLLHAAFGSETASTNWTRAYHKRRTTLSSRLCSATDPLLQSARGSTRPPRRRAVRQTMTLTSTGATSYGPHHIPASLRDEWITDKFRQLAASKISLRLLRRTAAARLVQMSAGCSLWEAARWLGIRPRAIQVTAADDTPHWQRSHPQHAHAFTAAVGDLVHHLDTASERIDYRHRRESLRDWWIPALGGTHRIDASPRRPRPGTTQMPDGLRLRLDDNHPG